MSQAGDVDGDGVSDLIVGAWQHRSAARSGGRCTLHSGKDGKVLATYTCRQAGRHLWLRCARHRAMSTVMGRSTSSARAAGAPSTAPRPAGL